MDWKLLPKLTGPLPSFNEDGVLPYGDYLPTIENFRERFVDILGSVTRRKIFDGFIVFCNDLKSMGFPEDSVFLIDGSFTTKKPDPSDIDFVTEYPYLGVNKLYSDLYQANFFKGGLNKDTNFCDDYAVLVFPETDPLFIKTKKMREYWLNFFGRTRPDSHFGQEKLKGRVWLHLSGVS